MFMPRNASLALKQWFQSPSRKPLVIRGARQVGKTSLIRHFAQSEGKQLIELNFERRPDFASAFTTNDPHEIVGNLRSILNHKIIPEECILFLDEIQAYPELLAKLRWFAEEMPELPVVTAGSLLEFVLADHTFSMPVGRISYLHLEPLSFEEYLSAIGEHVCREWLEQFTCDMTVPEALHQKFLNLVKEYSLIGGMPAAVASWAITHSLEDVHQIHHELMATYYDDFSKYSGKIPTSRLQKALNKAPEMLGKKCIYAHINSDLPSTQMKHTIDLLAQARLIHRVYHSHGNGVPLAAEIKETFFKLIYIDIGLASSTLGLKFNNLSAITDLETINQGGLSEQFVGQILRTIEPYYVEPQLYYWAREEKGSSAEVDYLIAHGTQIIPLEVKSGRSGSLKSLHLFMSLKNLALALRICSDLPSQTQVEVKLFDGSPVSYRLLSLPFYLLGQFYRLIDQGVVGE
jgi:predicted AAA+ superfamily ATPase